MQAVHSLLYIVAKCNFFSVVTWKDIIKYLQKCEGCTHFCEQWRIKILWCPWAMTPRVPPYTTPRYITKKITINGWMNEWNVLRVNMCFSKNENYVRLLFIDHSSAFNTIVPIKLAFKLTDLDPLTAPLLLSNLLMILWFWASFPTMMRPHTWMR